MDLHRGRLLATVLAGGWRAVVPPVALTQDELDIVVPLIVNSGTAGLAWRRIRNTALAATEGGRTLRQARLITAAQATIRESQIERQLDPDAFGRADPILIKGWANGRPYPEPSIRHYTDIDLLVRPENYAAATQAWERLLGEMPESTWVDLQQELRDLPDRTWDDLYARADVVPLRSVAVTILGPEDALRLSCLHLLRHLGCNPIWLCDVSAMLENLRPGFDWNYCLSGQPRRTEWMLAVIRLANQVLGANVERCPTSVLPVSVPSWMPNTLLRVWGRGDRYDHPWPLPSPLGHVRDVRRLAGALAERWPTPIESIYRLSWPINRVSGRSAQLLDYCLRALGWFARIVGHVRRSRPQPEIGLSAG
jgi:hypothetical protein